MASYLSQAPHASRIVQNDLDDEHVFHELSPDHQLLLTPKEIYLKTVHFGVLKSNVVWWKTLALAVIAGGYVGLGGATCFLVAGALNQAPGFFEASQHNYGFYKLFYGAFGFPLALTAIVVCGGELFTSHCAYTYVAWQEAHIPLTTVMKMLTLIWVGNFIGCVFVAWLLQKDLAFEMYNRTLVSTVESKLAQNDVVVFVRAVFANWFIAIASWMANSTLDFGGKGIAVFLPIFSFAAIGFEGCIVGAQCDAGLVMKNIAIATAGNWIGGVVFTAFPICLVYGQPNWAFTKARFY